MDEQYKYRLITGISLFNEESNVSKESFNERSILYFLRKLNEKNEKERRKKEFKKYYF